MKKFFLIPLMTLVCSVMAWAGVAQIGKIQYETLNAAFAAAKSGDAIELLEDVTVSSQINVAKDVTLHMFGHTIYNACQQRMFYLGAQGVTLTVVGNPDGISANAKIIIPNSNHKSWGIVDYRSTNGTAYEGSGFVAYNVDFSGATCYGSFFRMRTDYQRLMLQDCNVHMHKGDTEGGLTKDSPYYSGYVGENGSICGIAGNHCDIRCLRGRYIFDTWYGTAPAHTECPGMFTITGSNGNLELSGIELISNNGIIEVCDNAKSTFTDCKITGRLDNTWTSAIIAPSGYSTVSNNAYAGPVAGYFGDNSEAGVINVNSGEYKSAYPIYVLTSGGVVNVTGGKFIGTIAAIMVTSGSKSDVFSSSNGLVNVIGGEFSGNLKLERYSTSVIPTTSTLNIAGGTFTNVNEISLQNEHCHLNITGGTFSGTAITAESLANYVDTENGYIITDNGDGSFTVTQQQSTEDKAAITWQDSNDWSADEVPGASTEVSVAANQTVTVGDNVSTEVVAEAKSIALAPNSELVIKSGSTLVVGEGGITGTGEGASDAKIIVEEGGQLLISPAAEQHPYGTVKYKSVAKVDGDYEGGHIWEQIGVPTMGNPSVEATEHAAMYFNVWDPTNGWVALSDYSQFNTPFKGYNFTNASNAGNVVYTFSGQLVGNQQQALDFPRDGYSFFANSYTGPIDIVTLLRQFETGSDVQRGVYLYDAMQEKYLPINEANAGTTVLGIYYPAEIKPMQAFYLYSHASTSGNASYEDLVWTPARAALSGAPRRQAKITNNGLAIQLKAENGRCDNVILAETANSDLNTYKMMNPSKSVNIYAVSENGKMANFAAEDINNTFIGFTTNGSASYTLSFDAVNGEYALRDMYTGNTVRIENGMEYTFEAMPNGTMESRFQIVKVAKVPTGMDQVLNEVLCTKVVENGVLYIIKDGVKYNAQGALVK